MSYGELTVARKQHLLGTDELIVSVDPSADTQNQTQLMADFRKEIQLLVQSGALPDFVYQLALESLSVRSYLALHTDSNEAFRYYELTNESGNICGIYDAEQDKILGIELRILTELYLSFTLEETKGTEEEAFAEQLRAWANYYSHVAEDISIQVVEGPISEAAYVIKGDFSQGNDSYCFALLYERDTERFVWGVIPAFAQEPEAHEAA